QTQKSSPAEAGAANSGYGACRLAIMCKSVAVSHVHSYARCVAVGTPTPPRGASATTPKLKLPPPPKRWGQCDWWSLSVKDRKIWGRPCPIHMQRRAIVEPVRLTV